MARYKHFSLKKKLIKAHKRTRYGPMWVIFAKYGKGKRKHPSQFSRKRNWRRDSCF